MGPFFYKRDTQLEEIDEIKTPMFGRNFPDQLTSRYNRWKLECKLVQAAPVFY